MWDIIGYLYDAFETTLKKSEDRIDFRSLLLFVFRYFSLYKRAYMRYFMLFFIYFYSFSIFISSIFKNKVFL